MVLASDTDLAATIISTAAILTALGGIWRYGIKPVLEFIRHQETLAKMAKEYEEKDKDRGAK